MKPAMAHEPGNMRCPACGSIDCECTGLDGRLHQHRCLACGFGDAEYQMALAAKR